MRRKSVQWREENLSNVVWWEDEQAYLLLWHRTRTHVGMSATSTKEWRNEHRHTADSVRPLLCWYLHRRILAPELATGSFTRWIYTPRQLDRTSAAVPDQHQKAGDTWKCPGCGAKKDSTWNPHLFYIVDWRMYYTFKLSILDCYAIPYIA
jgi:rubredoxin